MVANYRFIFLWLFLYYSFYIQIGCTVKRYSTAMITKVNAKSYQPDVVQLVEASMRKVNRTTSFATISAKFLKKCDTIPVSIELSRLSGSTSYKLPFNITGDGCHFLKTDYLICNDLKRAGVPNCPWEGDIAAKDLHFANMPPIDIRGKYIIKVSAMYGKKLMFIVNFDVTFK